MVDMSEGFVPSENEGKVISSREGEYEIRGGVRHWISPSTETRKRIYKDRMHDARANRRRGLR